jgi:hypothetical protein
MGSAPPVGDVSEESEAAEGVVARIPAADDAAAAADDAAAAAADEAADEEDGMPMLPCKRLTDVMFSPIVSMLDDGECIGTKVLCDRA